MAESPVWRRRRLSPARRAKLEQELAELRTQYRDLGREYFRARGKQRAAAYSAYQKVGARLDATLYRLWEDNGCKSWP